MELGSKSIEVLIQLLARSHIAEYPNMKRFLQVYHYPNSIIFLFDAKHDYPAGSMDPEVYKEWGSRIIRRDLSRSGIVTRSGFFMKLATDILNEIEDNVLDLPYDQCINNEDIEKFHRYLELDGYKYENRMLVPIEYDSGETQQTKSLMECMIDCDPELSSVKLIKHLRDCEENYHIGHWKDSIAQARNFVEQLLEDIAEACAKGRKENPDLLKPVKVRNYLAKVGFFEEEEKTKLVDGVYGHLSEKGSHPGISDDKVARVSRTITISFGYYCLEKFESWKKNNYTNL